MSDYQDEWLKRIDGQLTDIGKAVAPLLALSQRLEEHHSALYGNGQPGLLKDVDRLKQWQKSLYWFVGLLGTATVGDLISAWFKR